MGNQNENLLDSASHASLNGADDLPEMIPIPAIRATCHIYAATIQLVKLNSSLYALNFTVDSNTEALITVHFFVVETQEGLSQADTKFPAPVSISVPAGNTVHLAHDIIVDTNQATAAELTFIDRRLCPIVIEVKPVPSGPVETTFLALRHTPEGYIPKLLKQQLLMNDSVYILKDVYGTPWGTSQEESDCAICLENKRDTLVVPCCHLCLCVACGDSFRTQVDKRCPICRAEVTSLIRVPDEI